VLQEKGTLMETPLTNREIELCLRKCRKYHRGRDLPQREEEQTERRPGVGRKYDIVAILLPQSRTCDAPDFPCRDSGVRMMGSEEGQTCSNRRESGSGRQGVSGLWHYEGVSD